MSGQEVTVRGDLEWGTIPRMVQSSAARFGSATAIADPELTLTYDALLGAVREATKAFIAAGIQPDDRVAIWAPNIGEWIVAAVAAQAAGAVLVPLNTRFKGTEAAYVVNRSRARLLFTVTDFLDTDYVALLDAAEVETTIEATVVLRGSVPEGCLSWHDFVASGNDVEEAAVDAAIEQRTSDDLSPTSSSHQAPPALPRAS